jgi:hypothetical protein
MIAAAVTLLFSSIKLMFEDARQLQDAVEQSAAGVRLDSSKIEAGGLEKLASANLARIPHSPEGTIAPLPA